MDTRLRDGLLAIVALAVLLRILVGVGAVGALTDSRATVGGVGGMLALEIVFLRFPRRTLELWERPLVQGLSVLGVVAVGIVAAQSGVVLLLAVLVWGLGSYLLLLAVVVIMGENPLARVVGR